MTKYQSTKSGFTLLELLAVMALMIILATIAVTSYRSMVTGSGITASLAHLRQTLALTRQQAIMQGKNAYVVFYQDTNESWYVTCLAQGTKNERPGSGQMLMDVYRTDWENVGVGALLFNLSQDEATFSPITGVVWDDDKKAHQIVTADEIWGDGDRYGWEVSKKVKLPRGFRFVDTPPSTVRFKPNGTAVKVSGSVVGSGQYIKIIEEIHPDREYAVVVEMNGSTRVEY